jgi:alkylresorcinol/alkylpyrone synthase
MGKLISIGTCDAPYILPQEDVKEFVHSLFSTYPNIDNMISVFDNSGISRRHFSVPISWYKSQHSFGERNLRFKEMAMELTEKSITGCLESVNVSPDKINCIINISSTGVVTPTIDAILFNKLGFSNHIKRIPIWGLGCAGGAAGISRAMEYVKAFPKHNCLVIATELCSLTFQKDDLTKSNIIAASLFSDGCAALLVTGDETEYASGKGISLVDSLSTIYNDSLDVMGWDVIDDGFRVIFSRDIPAIVKEYVKANIEELASRNELRLSEIKHFVSHPGGAKVIKAYEESLGLNGNTFKYTYKVLSEHGNMSAPSVIYVLKEFFDNNEFQPGEYGIISALGPGFSSELVLFKAG